MCMPVMQVRSMLVTVFTLFVCVFVAVLPSDFRVMRVIMVTVAVGVLVLVQLPRVDMSMFMFFSDSQVSANYHKSQSD